MDRFCSSTLRLLAIAIGGSVFLSAGSLPADVKLPALFSDHMVLQADADVPIWGWANPGEEVAVTLADTKGTVKAGADGKWQVILAKLKAGGPYALEVKGINTLTVKDVLVGEVWL